MIDPWLYFVTVLALLGMPGPTNTLLASAGATQGLRRCLGLIGAALAGYIVAIATIRLVLIPVISEWPVITMALKVSVATYLVMIAIRMWRNAAQVIASQQAVQPTAMFVATLLNPKAIVFALSVLPQHEAGLLHYAVFSATATITGLAWVMVGRLISAAAGARRTVIVQKAASAIVIGFAGLIAASVFG